MTAATTSFGPDSTSAAGAMMRKMRQPLIIGSLLAGTGTSALHAAPEILIRAHSALQQTTSGTLLSLAEPAGASIAELRRLSGLTWDQLARLFSVSRRSLHFWASGKPMAPSNEEHLQRLLAVVRAVDRGSASANRSALLGVTEDGQLAYDLLAAGEYDRVVKLLGSGETHRLRPAPLSEKARAARAPRAPEELVGALQDRIHPTSGRLLSTKPVRISREK